MKLVSLNHFSFLYRREFANKNFARYVTKRKGKENGTMARDSVGGDQ